MLFHWDKPVESNDWRRLHTVYCVVCLGSNNRWKRTHQITPVLCTVCITLYLEWFSTKLVSCCSFESKDAEFFDVEPSKLTLTRVRVRCRECESNCASSRTGTKSSRTSQYLEDLFQGGCRFGGDLAFADSRPTGFLAHFTCCCLIFWIRVYLCNTCRMYVPKNNGRHVVSSGCFVYSQVPRSCDNE